MQLGQADECTCPICLEDMKDPVTVRTKARDGSGAQVEQYYCKACILEWFEKGNNSDPNNRGELVQKPRTGGVAKRELDYSENRFIRERVAQKQANLRAQPNNVDNKSNFSPPVAESKQGFIRLPKSLFVSGNGKPLTQPILLSDGTTCNREELAPEDRSKVKSIKNVLVARILTSQIEGEDYLVDVHLLENHNGDFFQQPVVALHGNGGTAEEQFLKDKEIKEYYPNKLIAQAVAFAKQQVIIKPQPANGSEMQSPVEGRSVADLRQPLLEQREGQSQAEEKVPPPRPQPGEGGDVLIPPEADGINRNPEGQNVVAQEQKRGCCRYLYEDCRKPLVVGLVFVGASLGLGFGLATHPSPTLTPIPPTYSPDIVPWSGGITGITFQNPNQQDIPISSIQIVSNVENVTPSSSWLPRDVNVKNSFSIDLNSYVTTITPGETPIQLPASGGSISFYAGDISGPLKIQMDPKTVSVDVGAGLQQLEIQGKTNATNPTPNIDSVASIPQSETGTATYHEHFRLKDLPTRVNTIEHGSIEFDSNGDFVTPQTDLATAVVQTSRLVKQFFKFLQLQLFFDAAPDVCEHVLNDETARENLASNIADAVRQTDSKAVRIGCEITPDNAEQYANLVRSIKAQVPLGTKIKVTSPKAVPVQLCLLEPYVDEFTVQAVKYNNATVPVSDYPAPVRSEPGRTPNQNSYSATFEAYNKTGCIKEAKVGVVLTTSCETMIVDDLGSTNGVWRRITARLPNSNYRCVQTGDCSGSSPPHDLECIPAMENPFGNNSRQGACSSEQARMVEFCEDPTSIPAKMQATKEILGHKFSGYTFDNIVRDTPVTLDDSLASAAFDSQPTHGSQQTNSTPNFTAEAGQTFTGLSFTDLFNLAIEKLYDYFPEELRGAMTDAATQGALCGFFTTLTEKFLIDRLSSGIDPETKEVHFKINPMTKQPYTKEEIFWICQSAKAIAILLVTFNPIAAVALPVGSGLFRLKLDFESASKCASYSAILIALLTLNPWVLAAGIGGCALGSTVANLGCKVLSLGNSAVKYVASSNPRQYCAKQAYQVANTVQQGFFALKDRAAGFANRFNPFGRQAPVPEAVDAPVCAV